MPSVTTNVKPLPGIFIHKDIVNQRVKNYRDNKLPLLSQAMGKPETEAAWYSMEQFEEMMREMYYQHADGLRIYFGAYNANDPEYANQMTIIFVPTYLNEATGKHADIIIDDDEEFQVRSESTTSPETGKMVIEKNLDTIALCPPACAGNEYSYPY